MGIKSHIDLEPLKRTCRNWWRKINRVKPGSLPEPFFHAVDIAALNDYFSSRESDAEGPPETAAALTGQCYVCNAEVNFQIKRPEDEGPVNWRETLSCPDCGLINRWRSCLHLFDAICEPTSADRIYLTETLSPVCQQLESRYPLMVSSEYLPQAEPGETVEMHSTTVRNEDVTQLTFADRSFEAVLCFDVMEHVPDYRKALREFYRVLASGRSVGAQRPFQLSAGNPGEGGGGR